MKPAYDILRSGAWLTCERIRLVAIAILSAGRRSLGFVLGDPRLVLELGKQGR